MPLDLTPTTREIKVTLPQYIWEILDGIDKNQSVENYTQADWISSTILHRFEELTIKTFSGALSNENSLPSS